MLPREKTSTAVPANGQVPVQMNLNDACHVSCKTASRRGGTQG